MRDQNATNPPSPGPVSTPRTTVAEVRCPHCNYSLRGLHATGRCPECGSHYDISNKRRGPRDRLGDAPLFYLRRLTIASLAAGTAGLVALAALFVGWVGSNPIPAILGLLAHLAYTAALTVVALPRKRGAGAPPLPFPASREWLSLKLFGIGGQLLLIPTILLAAISASLTTSAQTPPTPGAAPAAQATWLTATLDTTAVLCFAAYFASFFPLGFLLANYADWADDDSLASKLRGAGWIVGVLGPFAVIAQAVFSIGIGGIVGFAALVGAILASLATIVALAFFPVACLLFASTCQWAKRNKDEERERDARLAERRKRAADDMVQTSEASEPEPHRHNPNDTDHQPLPANIHRYEPQPSKPKRPDHPGHDPDPTPDHQLEDPALEDTPAEDFPDPPPPPSTAPDIPDDELNPYTLEDDQTGPR
mgnify:FL=1